eukprot:CAMPEP_0170526632 /NCGR_PEP_ID=MMETSP0209-20121228/12036_1 /TAXON_ID=665100 ORGANISM="Litonotus pictus, Strain P1" /NCGR_SAMPLE_ID=MMETSP0209 /ASSEMBLY_ACC=CAM_ASM_000301 /LENGTH=315 /DNA_ID=CAMNT_0010816561 /DNA_START=282 /DNA_END=1225 /DNA_ORIENTATION=+
MPFSMYSSSNKCALEYHNFNSRTKSDNTADKSLSLEFSPVRVSGYTIGFWSFADAISEGNYWTVELEGIMKIKLTSIGYDLDGMTGTNEDFSYEIEVTIYDKSQTLTMSTATNTIPDANEMAPGDYFTDTFNKWVHVKAGFSPIINKGFIEMNLYKDDTPMKYFVEYDLGLYISSSSDTTKNNFNINKPTDKLKVTIDTSSSSEQLVIRDLAFFGTYKRGDFQNFELLSTFTNDEALIGYARFNDFEPGNHGNLFFTYYDSPDDSPNDYTSKIGTTNGSVIEGHITADYFHRLNLLSPSTKYLNWFFDEYDISDS